VSPAVPHFASFKFKVSALVMAMVLIAAIAVGGLSLLIAEVQMQRMTGAQELSALAGAAAYIDNDLRAKQQLLKSVAEEAQVRGLGPADVQALLEAHATLRDEFINVASYDAQGERIASLRNRQDKALNVSNRAYFKETLATHEGVISAPFRSGLSGRPAVALTQPLADEEGRIYAVLVAGIDLLRPSFAAQIEALRSIPQGYLFIVGADGTVVHHPRKDLILTRPDLEERPALHAALAAPEGWRADLVDDGQPVFVAYKRLRQVDWTVGVSSPLHAAFAPMAAVWMKGIAAAAVFTALAGVFGWGLVKVLMEPLDRLQKSVEAIDSGATDISALDVQERDEFGLLSRALYRLSRHRQQAEDELHRLATTDVLTGTYNRRMFDDFLPAALARARRAGESLAVAFLDVDRFKTINDTHGHAVGDAVLVEFARRLQGAVRATDTVARLAGDEFVIVYEQLGDTAEAHRLGSTLLAAMAQPFQLGGTMLRVSASVGIAITRHHASAQAVLQSADYALYGVKAAGRGGYAVNVVGTEKLACVRGHEQGRARPREAAARA
jgi:diguanylate cyclase (GGDEF)-like protein